MFKQCEFNVNLWTLCFVSYRKYPDPLKNLSTKWNNSGRKQDHYTQILNLKQISQAYKDICIQHSVKMLVFEILKQINDQPTVEVLEPVYLLLIVENIP